MARNGSGVYSLPPGSTVGNGDTSDATDLNNPLADIATDLNTARPVVAGGTGSTTASGARTNLGLGALATLASVDTAQIADSAVETAKINDAAVTTAKLADDAVTRAKIADAGMSGADATLITGTAGTAGNLAEWNADGDLVDGPAVSSNSDWSADGAAHSPRSVIKAYVDGQSSGGLTLGTEQASTSGTVVDFTGISADAKAVHILYAGVSFTGSSPDFRVQLGDAGGFETSGYSSTSVFASGSEVAATSSSGFLVKAGPLALQTGTGRISIRLKDAANNEWVSDHVGLTSQLEPVVGGGSKSLSGTLTQIRFTSVSGATFDAGSINIQVET